MNTAGYITQKVLFNSQDLKLEGILHSPPGKRCLPAVVVCHPHPQFGGSMDNNVVNSLCESLAEKSIIALKFNYRGTGQSQGCFDEGRGEQFDAKAAFEYLLSRPEVDACRAGLAGYSAGAAWGLPAVYKDTRVKALVGVSPPLGMLDFHFLTDCQKPCLLISGSRDNLVNPDRLKTLSLSNPDFIQYSVISEADHIWWKYEDILASRVAGFFTANL
ncbi:MAG TPA: hypothetical protein VLH15_09250 [Dehalococcoidales bacterium]|nr:hypothetical protein [Dehalococcoidales bacterium]